MLVALALAVELQLQSNLSVAVTLEAGAASVSVPGYKAGSLSAPEDARTLTVEAEGCTYLFQFRGTLPALRSGYGPVRLYLSHEFELYAVPDDLELETPVEYLKFRQPADFPLIPAKQCAPIKPG